jgi:PilZ domain-containing protein
MDRPVIDRRAEARLPASAIPIAHATLRPACPVQVIDLSAAGLHVESERPLRPGSRVHVRLVSDHWSLVLFALIVRCYVSALDSEGGIRYRGALQFDERCSHLAPDPPADGHHGSWGSFVREGPLASPHPIRQPPVTS